VLLEYPDRIAEVRLDEPLFAIAPGEVVLFFEESRVLGSAVVSETEPAGASGSPARNAIEKPASPA
jgi:hypothetical protein